MRVSDDNLTDSALNAVRSAMRAQLNRWRLRIMVETVAARHKYVMGLVTRLRPTTRSSSVMA